MRVFHDEKLAFASLNCDLRKIPIEQSGSEIYPIVLQGLLRLRDCTLPAIPVYGVCGDTVRFIELSMRRRTKKNRLD